MKVLLFTNLYPCADEPLHGSFVRERTERLAARMGLIIDCWRVVVFGRGATGWSRETLSGPGLYRGEWRYES